MRILVAEDEARAKNAIIQIISKNRPQCKVVGVNNGSEAIECINSGGFELLLTDVKMPHMDGLTLLENVKRLSPGTTVVVISAYSYFAYVQKALKVGAYDYLLKPFTDSALLGIVDEIAGLSRAGSGTSLSNALENETGRALLFFPVAKLVSPEEELLKLESGLKDIFNKEETHITYCGRDRNSLVVYLSCEAEPGDYFSGRLKDALHTFLCNHIAEGGAAFTASIGTVRKMSDIYESVADAHRYADLSFYYDEPAVFTSENLNAQVSQAGTLNDKFYAAVKACDVNLAKQKLADVFTYMKESGFPPSECKAATNLWASELITKYGTAMLGETREYLLRQAELLSESAHYRQSAEIMAAILENICASVLSLRGSRTTLLMEKSMTYIEEHYHEPDLCLTKIADRFHFNPAYYSSLFKKQTGLSVGKYLLDLRLVKAKKLLTGSNAKIYEIASRVGFTDDKYFIRVFVKENGITPGAYRFTECESN